ncbi:MAG: homocysteine S-methyltransferase family protein [Fimbriimonadales bacterium]
MKWLDEALERGPILGDGAIGTMLLRSGLRPGESGELWNADRPDDVRSIHERYVEAGARFVTTNTFGCSPLALARHGLAERAAELNAAAVRISKGAAEAKARVLGDVGPFGGFLEPYGDSTPEEVEDSFRVQVAALRDAGADGIIVETMVDPVELGIAVRMAKEASDWPVLATYAFQKSGASFRTLMGTTVEEAMNAAIEAGAVGANCGTDLTLEDYLRLAGELVAAAKETPVILQPNAGAPREVDGVIVYSATPSDLADWARRATEAGVSIVGGCCGTTPAHIKAMAEAMYA